MSCLLWTKTAEHANWFFNLIFVIEHTLVYTYDPNIRSCAALMSSYFFLICFCIEISTFGSMALVA